LVRCKKYRLASALAGAILVGALTGCYNPRFPSESPVASPPENQQDSSQNPVVRDRRDSAAGSGASTPH
jgi:hypothetical protein